jgi:outer membrane protein TolC
MELRWKKGLKTKIAFSLFSAALIAFDPDPKACMKVIRRTLAVMMISIVGYVPSFGSSVFDQSPEYLFPELREVLKKAEEHAIESEQASYTAGVARLRRDAALSNKKPWVSFGTGAGFYGDNVRDELTMSIYDFSLGLSYLLYQWGAKSAGHAMAENQYILNSIAYEDALSRFGREIRESFLGLIIDRFSLRALEVEVAIAQENIATDTLSFEEGRMSSDNYERVMASRKMQLMDLEQNRKSLVRKIQDFRDLTGVEDFQESMIPSSIPRVANYDAEILSMAQGVRARGFADITQVRRADIAIDNAEQNIIQAEARFRPTLRLFASTSMSPEISQNNDLVVKYAGGVRVNWDIYSGGSNQKVLEMSLFDRRRELAGKRNTLINVEKSLERLTDDLVYQRGRLDISEQQYQMALADYEKSKDEYARGRLSEVQFLQVELSRIREERGIYQSRRNYMVSVSNFLSFIGKDPILNLFPSFEDQGKRAIASN